MATMWSGTLNPNQTHPYQNHPYPFSIRVSQMRWFCFNIQRKYWLGDSLKEKLGFLLVLYV